MSIRYLLIVLILSISLFDASSQQLSELSTLGIDGVNQGSVDWGDYDMDGYADILLTGYSDMGPISRVYKNSGANTFTEQPAIALPGVFLSEAIWFDYDCDGDLDILLSGTIDGTTLGAITKIFRNDSGSFTEIVTALPGLYYSNLSAFDFNKDGLLDIFLTGMSDEAERISKIYINKGNGSFDEASGTKLGGVIFGSAEPGDYNNDGYVDIMITGQNSAQVNVAYLYRNNGDGSFSEVEGLDLEKVIYSSIVWADINHDGLLDLLYCGENKDGVPITVLYQNQGNDSFVEISNTGLPGIKNGSIAAGDYDNDGDLDFFLSGTSEFSYITEVYTNCNGSFCSTPESLQGVFDSSVSLGDMDNDKDLDLLLIGIDDSYMLYTKIYENSPASTNTIPTSPTNMTYKTIGTDAILSWDRVSSDETPAESMSYNIKIGRSPGTEEYVPSHSEADGTRMIYSYGNTYLDTSFVFKFLRWDTTYVASVQAIDNSFEGSSFSANTNIQITAVQPSNLYASFNSTTSKQVNWTRGNGDRCIVFAKEGSTGIASPVDNTTYYANSIFKEGSPLGTDWYCIYKGEADSVLLTGLETQKDYTFHIIEYQGENGSELYAASIEGNVGVFSTGLFTNQSAINMPGLRFTSVAWGDYNNDGFLDALIAGLNLAGESKVHVFTNNADNTFTELTGANITGVYNCSVGWGDYNNDSFLDILVTGRNESLGPISKLYKNNGDNTFTEQTDILLTGVENSSAAWGDYDNDGDLDIIVSGKDPMSNLITRVYRNQGGNDFEEQTQISISGFQNGSLDLGDYDGDGYLDILLTGFISATERAVKIYRNTGNNNFQEQSSMSFPGLSYSSGEWGDYDNDGNLDIILAGAQGDTPDFNTITRVYRNNGDNSFSEPVNLDLPGLMVGALAWGDYNNDGNLDILITGYTESDYIFEVFHNNGDDTFTENPFVELPGTVACDVKWADYDNDGDLDILISGYTGALISRVYKNNKYMRSGNIEPNSAPDTPGGLSSVISPGDVTLYWDEIINDETPPSNMSYNVRCRLVDSTEWNFAPQSLDDGSRNLVSLGNVQLNKEFIIEDPVSGKYYWQVQAVDQGFKGSAWSDVDSFFVKSTQAYFFSDTACFGSPTSFTDQSVVYDGIASWVWDFGDGNSSVQQFPTHTFSSSGTQQVSLVVESNNGDKDTLIQDVIVKPVPIASFTSPNVCIGDATPLNNTTDPNGLTITGWLWEFGDNQTSNEEQVMSHTYPLAGNYQTRLTAMASNGCSDTITNTVIIAGYPGSSISTDMILTFCRGDTLTLSCDNDPLYEYQWQLDGNDLTDANDSILKVADYTASYSVRISNTLANCITNSEHKDVTIKDNPPSPVIISDNYTAGECLGPNPVKLKLDQVAAGNTYQWLRNEVPIIDATESFIEGFLEPGNFTVIAGLDGCEVKSSVFEVSSQGAPEKPYLYVQGPNTWYLASNNTTAAAYKWYYNDQLVDGATKYYYSAGQNLGVYRVAVGNSNGCFTWSDTVRIPLGDLAAESLDGLKVYPNPSDGKFFIEINNKILGDVNISVINQVGAEVLKYRYEKVTPYFEKQIDLSGQIRGGYWVNIKMDGYSTIYKIIVE